MNPSPALSSTTPDDDSPATGIPAGPADRPSRDTRGLRSVAPWIAVIVLLAVAAIAAYGWSQAATDAQTEDRIEQIAGRAVSTLTTWDAADLAPVERAVTEFGTERFQQEAADIFGEFGTGLEQARVTSNGEVLELAVAEVSGDRAIALATVRQQVTNATTEEGSVTSCWGAKVTLVHLDGSWLVDHLSLFGPNACDG